MTDNFLSCRPTDHVRMRIFLGGLARGVTGLLSFFCLPLTRAQMEWDRVRKKNELHMGNRVRGSVTLTLTLTPRTKKAFNKHTG